MKSALITGCNRGIGLSLVKNLLNNNSSLKFEKVIATCRNLENAKELVKLSHEHKQLVILNIDLKEFNKYTDLASEVEQLTGSDGLTLLINNAGISTKFTRIGQLKLEQLIENFVINTAGPIMLTKALLPLLKKSADSKKDVPVGVERAAVINVSSILGSISENVDGGFYPYRCSKSALNAATKSLSLDLKKDNILVSAIHPGWCQTDMGGPNAPLPVDKATATFISTIASLGPKQNGQFLQYDGKVLKY